MRYLGLDRAYRVGMTDGAARLITWTGGAAIVAAAAAAFVLTDRYGESVFVARLVAGLAGCL
jgi:hypothetical protein